MRITKNLGNYNFANPREKQWLVTLMFSDGRVLSEHFPEDEEPDIDGIPPSELVDLIETRLNRYLYKSSTAEMLEKINWIRENAELVDSQWASSQIILIQAQSARLYSKISNLRMFISPNPA